MELSTLITVCFKNQPRAWGNMGGGVIPTSIPYGGWDHTKDPMKFGEGDGNKTLQGGANQDSRMGG